LPCRSRFNKRPVSSGLQDIQLADRSFDAPKFLAGGASYSRIVTAFIQGNREEFRRYWRRTSCRFDPVLRPDEPAAALVKLQGAASPSALQGARRKLPLPSRRIRSALCRCVDL